MKRKRGHPPGFRRCGPDIMCLIGEFTLSCLPELATWHCVCKSWSWYTKFCVFKLSCGSPYRKPERLGQFLAQNCTSLTHLHLKGRALVTNSNLQHVASLTRMMKLHLQGARELTLRSYRNISTLSRLQELVIRCSKVASVNQLGCIPSLTSLRLLNFYNVTNPGIQELHKLTNLRELSLSASKKITAQGLQPVFRHMQKLEVLCLARCSLHNAQALSPLKALKFLTFTQSGLQSFKYIEKLTNLETLAIYQQRGIMTDITGLIQLPKLQKFKCPSSVPPDEMCRVLHKLTNLTTLNLSCSRMMNVDILETLHDLPYLSFLSLNCCNLGDEACGALAELDTLTKLEMHMWDRLTDDGVAIFSTGLPSLTDLDMYGCGGISDAAVVSIGAAMHKLTKLCLRDCQGLQGKTLRSLTVLPNLHILDIQEMFELKVHHVACLAQCPNIVQFSVSGIHPKHLRGVYPMPQWDIHGRTPVAYIQKISSPELVV